jgi:uncharacterized protein YndB with AHSA1/START domain
MLSAEDGTVASVGEGVYDLRFERRYELSAAKVWAALTTPERIADWFSEAEVDLRVGGRFVLRGVCQVRGSIVELNPPRLLTWTWPDPAHPDSVVRWELFDEAAGCRLVLTQTRLRAPELVGVATGWHTHLEGLAGAADGARTPWSAERAARHAARYSTRLPA